MTYFCPTIAGIAELLRLESEVRALNEREGSTVETAATRPFRRNSFDREEAGGKHASESVR